jgi:hypothetical protein
MRRPERKQEDRPDPYAPRRLKSGKWGGCRHWTQHGSVGFDPKRAQEARSPAAGLTAHHHDFD